MPKGFPTPPKKEEQAIALAQTSMTQEAIAGKVGISRRQVGRIWKKAGISRRSEDTVRREVTKRLATEGKAPPGGTDPELGPHGRELFYFGQQLRDRLGLVMLREVKESASESDQLLMWSGRTNSPKDTEEERVDNEWGFGRYDARTHSLFPLFKQHLAGHPCWKTLGQVEGGFRRYLEACHKAHKSIAQAVKGRLPDLTEGNAQAMAESLWNDANYGITSSSELQRELEGGKVWWHLQLGAWRVGRKEDPAELKPLARVHHELSEALPSMTELKALAEANLAATQATQEFQQVLSPDARLRKLVLNGRCDQCP